MVAIRHDVSSAGVRFESDVRFLTLSLRVPAGAFHARLQASEGDPTAAHLARELPGRQPAMLDYAGGCCWSRGEEHDVSGPMPDAPISLHLGQATPAFVPAAAA